MSKLRTVPWEGFANARDLGGLPTRDGGTTRFGVFYRSATADFVTPQGWRQAYAAGVRTIIDLRNDDEVDLATAPAWITRRRVPLDGLEDTEFWEPFLDSGLHGTPLYYDEFLRRKSERLAAVMTTLAEAQGSVVFHCAGGRDRSGLITLLLLGLVGVKTDAIVDDYLFVDDSLIALRARQGRTDEQQEIDALLTAHGTDAQRVVTDVLATWDPDDYLRAAGVPDGDLARLRARLLG